MKRFRIRATAMTVILTAWTFQSVMADDTVTPQPTPLTPVPAAAPVQSDVPPAPFPDQTAREVPTPIDSVTSESLPPMGTPGAGPTAGTAYRAMPGYPYLNAPLYPSPVPNVPYQVGGTIITNQALYPHEMLYPHTYKAMYPPYYYRVNGYWVVMPWGVQSYEHWKVEGTEVQVKYRSHVRPFTGYVSPRWKSPIPKW